MHEEHLPPTDILHRQYDVIVIPIIVISVVLASGCPEFNVTSSL